MKALRIGLPSGRGARLFFTQSLLLFHLAFFCVSYAQQDETKRNGIAASSDHGELGGEPDSIMARCSMEDTCCGTTDPKPREGEEGPRDYIVTFKSYRNISEHLHSVHQLFGDCKSWRNLVRDNPAASLPTDFLVLRTLKSLDLHNFLRALEAHPNVKSLTKERQIDRSLFAVEDPPILRKMMNSDSGDDEGHASEKNHQRHILAKGLISITKFTNADVLWKKGHTGKGIRVAVFDTGIRDKHSSFRNVKERTDWTDEETLDDHIGHGTFVAGLIASTHSQCSGFAQDAEVYAFRVFNRKQVSYTSWFLDAFNYAILKDIDVLNLSIGGPDFLDRPFVEKVWEMSANGIIVVSAIGNDGPRYGTLNNPADQLDVIGVGGITYDDSLAVFSSRGMTTWEIPRGYGRVKPDIVAYGKGIRGPTTTGGCRSLSGTSVASPVVAGMVALLAGIADKRHLNPAMMKQILAASANPVPGHHIFEQGMGKVDLLKAAEMVEDYIPRASTIPGRLDLTDCPYMWPYCKQPIYYSAMPVIVNLTVLNPLSVSGTIENSRLELNPDGYAGKDPLISIEFSHSDVLWPWSGYLAISITVTPAGRLMSGAVSGQIVFDVVSETGVSETGEMATVISTVSIPLKINVSHLHHERNVCSGTNSTAFDTHQATFREITSPSRATFWTGTVITYTRILGTRTTI